MAEQNVNELLAKCLNPTGESNYDLLHDQGDNLERLHAQCIKGNLPDEYLRALAARAREVEAMNRPSREHFERMARTLEAWADE